MHQFFRSLAIGLMLGGGSLSAAPTALPAGLSGDALLSQLNETISWSRQVESSRQWIAQPSDEFFWTQQRSLTNQVIQQAFTSARAELPLVPASPNVAKKAPGAPPTPTQVKLATLAAARAARLREFQAEIASLNEHIRSAPTPAAAAALTIRRDALQSDVDFVQARQDALQKFGDILSGAADPNVGTTLAGQIDTLQRSVPEAFGAPSAPNPAPPAAAAPTAIIKRITTLFKLEGGLHGIDALIEETTDLQKLVVQMRAPLQGTVRNVVQQGDSADDQIATAGPAQLVANRQKLDSLTTEFKELTAVSLPLRQESQLFDQSLTNLKEWRDSIEQLHHKILLGIVHWLLAELAMLFVVFAIAEIWRRMTFRYVQDERRRRQFLLIRRLVTGVLMVAVIIVGFSSDISSFATFAGVITAGIAVALQTIILSIAAYFFMIGRSGLRVGDRIAIAGVTGDVMNVGPVRFYLRELSGPAEDLKPTGRMAIFSNAVIFQHSPLFRPLPPEKNSAPSP